MTPAGYAILPDSERERVGRDHADVDHVGAGVPDAFDECRRQKWAGDPHVATDDDGVWLDRRD